MRFSKELTFNLEQHISQGQSLLEEEKKESIKVDLFKEKFSKLELEEKRIEEELMKARQNLSSNAKKLEDRYLQVCQEKVAVHGLLQQAADSLVECKKRVFVENFPEIFRKLQKEEEKRLHFFKSSIGQYAGISYTMIPIQKQISEEILKSSESLDFSAEIQNFCENFMKNNQPRKDEFLDQLQGLCFFF